MTIDYACVADSSGIIVAAHREMHFGIEDVVRKILESLNYVDHRKSFSGHPVTQGYGYGFYYSKQMPRLANNYNSISSGTQSNML